MEQFKTISPEELARFKKLSTTSLYWHQRVFQGSLYGRECDDEFFRSQNAIAEGFIYSEKLQKQIAFEILRLTERLIVINKILDARGVNTLETSIN